jgi:hypothetical protein
MHNGRALTLPHAAESHHRKDPAKPIVDRLFRDLEAEEREDVMKSSVLSTMWHCHASSSCVACPGKSTKTASASPRYGVVRRRARMCSDFRENHRLLFVVTYVGALKIMLGETRRARAHMMVFLEK